MFFKHYQPTPVSPRSLKSRRCFTLAALGVAVLLGGGVTGFAPPAAKEVIISSGNNEWVGGTPEETELLNESVAVGNKGKRLLLKGDLDGAEKAFLRSLDLDPCYAKSGVVASASLDLLGDIYFRKEMWKESAFYYQRFFAAETGVPGGAGFAGDYIRYSMALMKTGEREKALRFYNLGMARGQNGERDLDDQVLTDWGNRRRMEAAARTAVAATEGVSHAFAAEQCRKALECLPDYAPAHLLLGNYLDATGKKAEARQEWLQAARHGRAGGKVAAEARRKISGE